MRLKSISNKFPRTISIAITLSLVLIVGCSNSDAPAVTNQAKPKINNIAAIPAASAPAEAKTNPNSAGLSIAQEYLVAQVPDGWIKGVDREVGELMVEEYFPADTQDVWEQKVVYESLTTQDLPDPIEYVEGTAASQADKCDAFANNPVYAGFENGYPTAVNILQCGVNNLTGKPILTVIKAIKGNKSLYTITRIWRLEPSKDKTLIEDIMDQAELAAWSNTLRKIIVCDNNLVAHSCENPD